jgi:hypothetical protein
LTDEELEDSKEQQSQMSRTERRWEKAAVAVASRKPPSGRLRLAFEALTSDEEEGYERSCTVLATKA